MLILLLGLPASIVLAEESPLAGVKFQNGPCVGELGQEAQIHVPGGYVFANGSDTRKLMEAMHNPPNDSEVGFLAPSNLEWFLVFEFSDTGYVKDDEKSSLDAVVMLKSLKAGNEAANRERKKRGWEPVIMTGWEQPPQYNSITHNLEWATVIGSNEGPTINWNTRLLGRTGVMAVTLVVSQVHKDEILAQYREVLKDFSFKSGHRYAEYRQGDKIAKYGLSALVVGGAAAVAVKAGLFKYIGKFLIFIFAAIAALFQRVAAFFKGIWQSITGKKNKQ